ncbi:MAG: nicotinate phosphoribosyltransferase, partial [Chloroflexota bacterium]
MTIFNRTRLTNAVFKLDAERMRAGWYSDKYFANILAMLEGSSLTPGFKGNFPRELDVDLSKVNIGNLEVEVQVFTRHAGQTIIVGVDKSL